jgi:glycosyltransferase involved in cell wall biosynthesis
MISVLIPVYNTDREVLKECINSVLGQTEQNFEIIVVDNQTEIPDTIEFLNEINQHEKISVVKCERQLGKKNLSVALNEGLKCCKYNLVARMDADDVMLPDRLEKQLNYMQENDVDILGGQCIQMSTGVVGRVMPEEVPPNMFYYRDHFLNHPSVMFKKDKIVEVGGYQETPDHTAEDFLLWTNCLKAGCKIANLKDAVLVFRDKQPQSLSMTDSRHVNWQRSVLYASTT